jgi:Kef-type K+ transport system membrane component KefB
VPSQTGMILLELFVAYAVARTAGELFTRLHLPVVVGEVLAGVALGPSLLGWVRPDATLQIVATLGAIVLLFQVGLATRAAELTRVGRTAVQVAVAGVIVPLAGGYALLTAFGYSPEASLFGAAALVATSVGVTARVLAEAQLSTTSEARIVLAAAVVDDVLGLLVLAVVAGVGRGGVDVPHLVVIALESVAFIAFQLLVAPRLVGRSSRYIERLHIDDPPLAVALIILLGFSALAERMGLAAIVGAFFAGMAFAETDDCWSLSESIKPLYGFLVPFFFVIAGANVDVRVITRPSVLVPGLALLAVAVASKVLGGGLGALPRGWRSALAVGVGMVPRGEVGLIIASAGLSLGVLTPATYGMLVLLAVTADVVASPFIPPLFRAAATAGA